MAKRKSAEDEVDYKSEISLIEEKKEELLQRIEDGDGVDMIASDLTKVVLRAAINILPNLERAAKHNPRGVYPLEKLINSVRELNHDMRTGADRGAMRERIADGIIKPALLDYVRQQITVLNRMQKVFRGDDEAEEMIATFRQQLQSSTNELHIKVADSLDAYFGGKGAATSIVTRHDVASNVRDDDDDEEGDDEKDYSHSKVLKFKKRRGK